MSAGLIFILWLAWVYVAGHIIAGLDSMAQRWYAVVVCSLIAALLFSALGRG